MINKDDCWLYAGEVVTQGYGRIQYMLNGKKYHYYVHRIMYEETNGAIPNGLVIDHLCRIRICVNPSHMEAVTIAVNVMRGEGKLAKFARQTYCKNGHELTANNLRSRADRPNMRECLTCHKVNVKAGRKRWRQRQKLLRAPTALTVVH